MYELTYIINPNLSDDEAAKQTDKVRGFINQEGGEIKDEKLNEKRRLAYQIKKQSFGFFVTIIFNIEPEKIAEIEKKVRLEPRILRHLLILKGESRREAASRRPIKPRKETIISKTAPETKIEKPEKVKIEEIDKKLEEILED